MRLIGHMIARNEAGRYLEACIEHLMTFCDVVHVMDDRSTDNTVKLARALGCQVTKRPTTVPTWDDHEGAARQSAFRFMEEVVRPKNGDFVLCQDADEALVAENGAVAEAVAMAIETAEEKKAIAIQLKIPEIWGFTDDGRPK